MSKLYFEAHIYEEECCFHEMFVIFIEHIQLHYVHKHVFTFSRSLRYCVRSTLWFCLPVASLASSAFWPIWDCSSLSWNLMYALRSTSSLLTLKRDCWLCRSTRLRLLFVAKHPFQSTIVPSSSIRHFYNWLLYHVELCTSYRSLHIRLLTGVLISP